MFLGADDRLWLIIKGRSAEDMDRDMVSLKWFHRPGMKIKMVKIGEFAGFGIGEVTKDAGLGNNFRVDAGEFHSQVPKN